MSTIHGGFGFFFYHQTNMILTFFLPVFVLSFPRYLDRFSLFRPCTRSNYGYETDSGLVLTLLYKLSIHLEGIKIKAKNNKMNDDYGEDNQFPTLLQRAMEKLQGDGFRTRGL